MVLELSLLVDLGLIVVFATFFNFIARALKQPSLLAYILAGVVLGPAGLGSLNWTFFDIPLGLTSLAEIRILSELGVAFLLFSIGVESDFSKLKSVGKVVLFAGILQVLITTTFVVLISNFLNLLSFSEALLLGLAISFSSTMVVIKILSDQKKLDTLHGRILVGILIVQDIIAIVLLPFITNISLFLSGEQLLQFLFSGAILVIISFALSKYVYPAVYQFAAKSHELLYLAALSSCFVFIFLAEFILHLPIPLGAFMAGLALSALPYSLDIYAAIKGLRDFFVTIFFTTLGLQLTFGSFFAPSFVSLFIFSLF
ncbi:MAG: cation:proton antiporter, partial [Candidatus Diapherotrites archaeon]|nr:cation:proton antiporter [Candidatus Diapherotrites archaeon]